MKLNPKVFVQLICIDYDDEFLRLVDYINEHNTPFEVPDSFYLTIYRNLIVKKAALRGDKNAPLHLTIDSLVENGIFTSHNKRDGILTFEPTFVHMLQYQDVTRARELSSTDLDDLRGRVEKAALTMRLSIDDRDLFEASKVTFNTVVNEVHSKIRINVERLTQLVEGVAIDYQRLGSGEGGPRVIDLHERVSTLYLKFVQPCMEFIDPNIQLKGKLTFTQAVSELIDELSSRGTQWALIANHVQYGKTRITSYYKDIAQLDSRLRHYNTALDQHRNQYTAIETAYKRLMDVITELRHGKQRNFMLNPNTGVLSSIASFDGLMALKMKNSAALNWEEDKTKYRFDEHLRNIEAKPRVTNKPVLMLEPEPVAPERAMAIHDALPAVLQPTEDIHKMLAEHLSEALPDYALNDLLYGLEYALARYHERIQPVAERTNYIDDGSYYMHYLPVRLLGTTNHV